MGNPGWLSRRLGPCVVGLALTSPLAWGQAPAGTPGSLSAPLSVIAIPSSAALSQALRDYLVKKVPPILYEKTKDWGKTTRVLAGVKLNGMKGKYVEKNNGKWKRIRVTAPAFAETLAVVLKDIKAGDDGRMTFSLNLAFPVHIDYTQQKWVDGVRLYDANVRARMAVAFALECEVAVHLEAGKGFLPDAVIDFRVLRSSLLYDKLVIEHVAGLGGAAAKLIGEIILASLKKWHPSLERHLLEKANAAIVKAGSNKEIRVGLDKLLKLKR